MTGEHNRSGHSHRMKYRGGYNIKDLRNDLEGGLGWAHSTESVAHYLETVIPTVLEAKIKGCFRHTSSQDKTDPKKVVTSSFYKSRGGKLATCHAHGDGTWSIAFTRLGKEELAKHASETINSKQLDVHVRAEVKDDGLYHYGEMKNKPLACRGHISLNSDEAHRMHHLDDQAQVEVIDTSTTIMTTVQTSKKSSNVGSQDATGGARGAPTHWTHEQQIRNQLNTEQTQLATDLDRDGLTKK
ncbi:hypothetical protein BKA67DRAFT_646667, partial [Truncatella angustata]